MTFVLRRALLASAAMGALSRPYDPFEGAIAHIYEPGRRTLTSYTGNLVRLRRASDDAEADFGYVAATGELDTAAIATWLGGANGYIVRVYDQKADSSIYQLTAAKQPLYVANAKNGHAGISFAGSNYLLQVFSVPLSQPYNICAVAQLDASVAGDSANHYICDSRNANRMILRQNSDNKWNVYAGAHLTDGASDADWHLWMVRFDGAGSIIRLDGASAASGNAGEANATGITVGSAYSFVETWVGLITSIVVFDPPADAGGVETAVNAYWSVY